MTDLCAIFACYLLFGEVDAGHCDQLGLEPNLVVCSFWGCLRRLSVAIPLFSVNYCSLSLFRLVFFFHPFHFSCFTLHERRANAQQEDGERRGPYIVAGIPPANIWVRLNHISGWDQGVPDPGASELDHLQPVKLILVKKFSTLLIFIKGDPILITSELKKGKRKYPLVDETKGFLTLGIQSEPFAAHSPHFVPKVFHLFTMPPIINHFFILQRQEGRR